MHIVDNIQQRIEDFYGIRLVHKARNHFINENKLFEMKEIDKTSYFSVIHKNNGLYIHINRNALDNPKILDYKKLDKRLFVGNMHDLLIIIEETSHFVYSWFWGESISKGTTLWETEFQGAVDKYILSAEILSSKSQVLKDKIFRPKNNNGQMNGKSIKNMFRLGRSNRELYTAVNTLAFYYMNSAERSHNCRENLIELYQTHGQKKLELILNTVN